LDSARDLQVTRAFFVPVFLFTLMLIDAKSRHAKVAKRLSQRAFNEIENEI
jgi:hypothetical protein